MNTNLSRQNSMSLLVALDQNQTAGGSLFWDDGDSVDTYENQNYNLFQFNYASNNTITITATAYHYQTPLILDKIQIYGLTAQPTQVMLMGSTTTLRNMTWNSTSNVLQISDLGLSMTAMTSVLLVSYDNITITGTTMTMTTTTTTITTTKVSGAGGAATQPTLSSRLLFILFLFATVFYRF